MHMQSDIQNYFKASVDINIEKSNTVVMDYMKTI